MRADCAVLATNAYPPLVRALRRCVVPLRVSLFETEPLGEEALAALAGLDARTDRQIRRRLRAG